MYLDFFGFKEKPFTITPNPRFMFLSKTHKEVFAHLLYGVRNRSGFIVVTGEVGTGKTTVLRTLFQELQQEHFCLAFIFNPSQSSMDLLRAINREYGLDHDGLSHGELMERLNEFLLEKRREGRTVVLVIDEAQGLDAAVLEQIRLLSNLETDTEKLIQIVLVGQPELQQLLLRSELRQLNQRITVRYHLEPMDLADTCDYIRHRLRVAGGSHRRLLEDAALKKIYAYSKGYPRLINLVCDRALLVAYGEGCQQVSARMVVAAIRELGPGAAAAGSRPWLWAGVAGALSAVLLLVFFLRP